jgi:nicotinate phosphoribosyltransferase
MTSRHLLGGILFTDLYQLTMAQVYLRMGLHDQRAQFDQFFRKYPDYGNHQAGYCITAGLEWLVDWMQTTRVTNEDLDALRSLKGVTGRRLFGDDFLTWLSRQGGFESLTLRAVPEGRVIHIDVPQAVVEGPLAMAQILETALLNHLNYPTLVATKASRVVDAGRGRPVIEFGLRRGPERAANAGARAALVGGAVSTSNVGVAVSLGFAPKGTHAHSLVQVYLAMGRGELEAFRAFAEVYPDDTVLLVDTVDTLESGVPNAITVFEELRARGHEPLGIRLDSGDLAYLAIRSAEMLDKAGFPDTTIVISSGLDELAIWQILRQIEDEAPRYGMDADGVIGRLTYGVGSNLITSQGDAVQDGVYKLVAVHHGGDWVPAIKISETAEKVPNPGRKSVWRVYDERGRATADLMATEDEEVAAGRRLELHHPTRHELRRVLDPGRVSEVEPLLTDILVEGDLVEELPQIHVLQERRQRDLERLDPGVRRLVNPHIYHVSLTPKLWALKKRLIEEALGPNVDPESGGAAGG